MDLEAGISLQEGGEGGHILVHPSYQGYYSRAEFAVYLC